MDAFDFFVQMGLMGQPPLSEIFPLNIKCPIIKFTWRTTQLHLFSPHNLKYEKNSPERLFLNRLISITFNLNQPSTF